MGLAYESRPPLLSCWSAYYSPHGTRDAAFLSNYAYIKPQRPHRPLLWSRPVGGLRSRPVCHAALDKARSAGETGHYRHGYTNAIQAQNK